MRRAGGRSWLGLALVLIVAGVVGVQSGVATRVSAPDGRRAGVSFEPFLRPPLLHPLGPSSRSLRSLRPQRQGRAATVITGSITAGGAPLVVTIPTSGDTASITFTATAGERVSLNAFNDSILYSWFSFSGPSASWSSGYVFTSGKFYEPVTLTTGGTYTISIDPQGNTGSVSLQLYDVPADPSGSITPGGAPVSVTTTAPGQNASYSFTAAAGQRVSLRIDTGTLTSPCGCAGIEYVRIMQGTTTIAGTGALISNWFDFIDVQTLNAGSYQVVIDPPGDAYGQTTLHLYDVPPDVTSPPFTIGEQRTITLGTPGQNALIPFHGQAGQRVTLQWSASTISSTQYKIEAPNGNELVGTNWEPPGTASISTTLSAGTSDNYKLYVNPFADATGQVTLTLTGNAPQENGCGFGGVFFGFRLAKCGSAMLKDPVNTLTGAFENQVEDVSVPGTGVPFTFTRSYTSSVSTIGRLGQGWTDSLAASLAIQQNGDVIVHSEDGQQVYYTKQPDGSFVGAGGALATLTQVGSTYQLLRNDQVTYTFDSQGRLTALKDRDNQGLTLTYNGNNQLATVTDAAGRQATLTYTGSLLTQLALADGRHVNYAYTGNLLTSATDLNGKTTTYAYDTGNRLANIIDPLGHAQVQNTYGTDGRVTQQKDALNKITTFAWDSSTQTATVTDPRGNTWKDVYQNGVLYQRIDAQSNATQFGFDSNLNETSVTSPTGQQVSLGYDAKGNLMNATAPASLGSGQKTFTYDAQNNVRTITDARNKLTQYGYDAAGNLNSIIQDGQQVFGATYNAQGQILTSTDGNQKQTTYTYDANGNVASLTTPDPDGAGPLSASKTTYTYNGSGKVLTKVDPLGNCSGCNPDNYTTTYTYDNDGRLLTETDPLGHTITHTYDDAGNELTVTDANNHTTTKQYDNANRLTQVTGPDPDGAGPLEAPVTKYTYDDVGNRLTMIDPRGNCSGCNPAAFTTTHTHDQNNRLASVTTPKGEKTTYTYDASGNLATIVDPRGNVQGANPDDYKTTNTYDAAGHVVTTVDPLGDTTTNHYDAVGNLDWTKDANLHQTSYTYDAAGRILTVTAPDTGVTTYTYDGNGNLKTRKDDNNHVTTYSYDDAGRLTQVTGPDPDGAGPLTAPITTYGYDLNVNRTSMTDPNGNSTQTAGDGTTSFSYDRANQLTGIDYSDTTPDATFGYDNVGNRTSMTDGSGSVSYVYDNLNRFTSSTRGTNTFSYTYDPSGNITNRTYPDSTQIAYTYDEDNRMASVASGGATTSYQYDPASHLTQTTLPSGNGYVETRSYDRAGRLFEVKSVKNGSTLADFVSTLDAVGNPTQIVQTGAVASTQTYTYDANDRILSVCFQAGTCPGNADPFIRWTYDKVGNRLTETRSGPATTNYTYNGLDELTQRGSTSYTYDQNGNEKTAGSTTLAYDLANRLKTHTSGSTTTTYSYDGDGNRLQASTGTQASKKTNYLWDATQTLPQLALERDGNNALLRRYVYGVNRISMFTGGASYYYHYDAIGSVRNVTSSTGVTQWTDTYEPYGAIRTETKNNNAAPTNLMKFAGQLSDPTGLYYLRARQYDPVTGRFIQPDPLGPKQGDFQTATYVYAGDRPTTMIDPSGEAFKPSDQFSLALLDAIAPVAAVDPPDATRVLYSSDSASAPDVSESGLPPVNPYRYKPDWGIARLCSVDLKCKSGENYIIYHESTWRPYARNGQYFGLGQLSTNARYTYLPRHPTTTDPVYQLYAMRRYIIGRYGTTANAVAFWKKHGRY